MNQQEAIQKFIQGTIADGAPVVPISAQLKYNVDVVCEYITKKIPVPVRCCATFSIKIKNSPMILIIMNDFFI